VTGRTAARITAGLLAVVGAFQVALVAGAPWGAFTQGGGNEGVLPTSGRIFALVSIAIVGVMALVILARAGEGPMTAAPRRLVTVLAWLTMAYMGMAILANTITPSPGERIVWAPMSVLIFAFGVTTMVKTARRR
jgi:hypothetical protein